MRYALLRRGPSTDHGTLGRLTLDGEARQLHVMEPPWRDNARNRSCIPRGRYVVAPHRSPRYGACCLVTDTAPRTHVLVHPGNVGGDVELGWHTHTLACLLPGLARGEIRVKGRMQAAVLSSRPAFRLWMAWAAGEPFALEIT